MECHGEGEAQQLWGGSPGILTKNRLVSIKKSSMLVERGSSAVNQGTYLNNAVISFQLGVRELTRASLSFILLPGV